MNTPKTKQREYKIYIFAGSIFKNISEMLNAAIEYHFSYCSEDEIKSLSNEELKKDAEMIASGYYSDHDSIKFPNHIFTVEAFEAEIFEQIKEKYFNN